MARSYRAPWPRLGSGQGPVLQPEVQLPPEGHLGLPIGPLTGRSPPP